MKTGGLLAALLVLLVGCSSPQSEPVPTPADDALIVVGDFGNPPFSSWDDAGNPVGLEVEILARVASELGRPVNWQEKPFAELLPSAENGSAAIAASTIGITEERARRVRFSDPYHHTEISVVARRGEGEPSRLSDLASRPVGAGRGTTSEAAVRREIPAARLIVDRDEDTTFGQLLLDAEIDALVLDRPAAERLVGDNPERLVRLDEHLGFERYAFAVDPARSELLEAINEAIRQFRAEGRLN